MEDQRVVSSEDSNTVVNIYPLSCYYFGSKQALPVKDETLAERTQRMRTKKLRDQRVEDMRGSSSSGKFNDTRLPTKRYFQFLVLHPSEVMPLLAIVFQMNFEPLSVELFKHPHLLLLQVKNSFFKLPGGRLKPGESETDGLKRKLSSKLSADEDGTETDWEVGECLGMWWRPDFETLMYPYLPPNVRRPKECTKLFLVKLPMSCKFIVPRNLKLLAIPLCQIHENSKTYGPIISGVPQLLSKFSFNIIEE